MCVADALAHRVDRLVDEARRRPVRLEARDVEEEGFDERAPFGRVHDLGVVLHAVDAFVVVGDRAERGVVARAEVHEARGHRGDAVAVAHPDAELGARQAVEQPARSGGTHHRVTELPVTRSLHLAAQLGSHRLHAVADAEYGHLKCEDHGGDGGRDVAEGCPRDHRLGAAGQDDAGGCEGTNLVRIRVPGQDLAVDTRLPDPAGDELGVLRAEVQDQDDVVVHGALSPSAGRRRTARPCRRRCPR